MALNEIDKANLHLKFQHRQNCFLTPPLCRLLCVALIQLLFDYAGTAWFSNLSKRLKFCLFKFRKDQCPDYFDELFCPVGENSVIIHLRTKY